jgi:D-alanyl-D-alanine carboxypeptidase
MLKLTRRFRVAIVVLIAFLNCCSAAGTICRSTKYPDLVLDVHIARNAESFLDQVRDSYSVVINNSYRSHQEQQALYEKWIAGGRKGNPVAKPGKSRHEIGFAFDLNRLQTLTFNQWNYVLNLGEQFGFEYLLGDWPGEGTQKFDWPHFQADPAEYDLRMDHKVAEDGSSGELIKNCPWKAELSADEKSYLGELVATNPHFSKIKGRRPTLSYIDVSVANRGIRSIKNLELRAELYDSMKKILRVRLLHPMELDEEKLEPGVERSFHLLFGNVYDFWKDGPLHVSVTYAEF